MESPHTMSEKIFATLLTRGIYSSSGTLISRVSASLAGIVIARALGPGTFGIYAAVMALIEFAGAFTRLGMVTGFKREGSRSPEALSFLFGNVLIVQLVLGLMSIGIALVGLPLVSKNPSALKVFPPVALVILSTHMAEPFLALMQIRGEQRLASFYISGRGLAFLAGTTFLASLGFDMIALAWYHGICYMVATLLMAFSTVTGESVTLRLAYLRTQIKGALPFGLSSALNTALGNLPVLCLSHFFPEESVGLFAVASRFVTISVLMGGVASAEAFVPALFNLFQADPRRFPQVCSWMQRVYIPMGIFVSSALYACSEALIVVIQGEKYRGAVSLLKILCWSVFFSYGGIAADGALTAGDRMRVKIAAQVCTTLAVALLSFSLVGRYGELGASVVAVLGTFMFSSLMVLYAFRKNLYSFSGLGGTSIPMAVTMLAAILTTQLMPSKYIVAAVLFFASSIMVWYPFLRPRILQLRSENEKLP